MLGVRRWALGVARETRRVRNALGSGGWVAGLGTVRAGDLPDLGPEAVVHGGDGWIIAGASGASPIPVEGRTDVTFRAAGEAGSGRSEVVLDPQAQTLTASADPFGLCGCYWWKEAGTVWCASSPRLPPLTGSSPRRLDSAALHGYLCFSHVPQPRSIFAGVAALPAGSTTVLSAGRAAITAGHAWSESPGPDTDPDGGPETLRRLLRAAVERCLGEETEAAVFLSGGLDSSLIAALLREAGVRLHLFTLDFGPPWNQELAFAEQVARHLERPLHVVPAGPGQVREHLEATAAALEQPFGDAVTVPLYLLGKAASQMCSLAFNGEGGDQLFGGWANKPMIAAELYGGTNYDRLDAYMATFHRFWGLTDTLYTPGARELVAGVDARDWVRGALEAPGCASLLHKLRAANLALKGAQNIAPRAIQLGAGHGLRVRCPFFDPKLANWSFSLPPEVFLQGACEKYLLKQVAERYLPGEVVWREKRGMGVPSAEWCLGPLKREIAHYLGKQRLQRDGWFEPRVVDALRKGVDQPGEFRSRRLGEKLWLLLMLHVWMDVGGVKH